MMIVDLVMVLIFTLKNRSIIGDEEWDREAALEV